MECRFVYMAILLFVLDKMRDIVTKMYRQGTDDAIRNDTQHCDPVEHIYAEAAC
jgi:hypothetical protein